MKAHVFYISNVCLFSPMRWFTKTLHVSAPALAPHCGQPVEKLAHPWLSLYNFKRHPRQNTGLRESIITALTTWRGRTHRVLLDTVKDSQCFPSFPGSLFYSPPFVSSLESLDPPPKKNTALTHKTAQNEIRTFYLRLGSRSVPDSASFAATGG